MANPIEDMLAPLTTGSNPLVRVLTGTPDEDPVGTVTEFIAEAGSSTIWFLGNGGSATAAAHVALDALDAGIRACSLPDVATLSARANDYGYERALWSYVSALRRPSDRFVLISVSGESRNILHVAGECRQVGLPTLSLVGRSGAGRLSGRTDLSIAVDSDDVTLVEYIHQGLLVAAVQRIKASPQCAEPAAASSNIDAHAEGWWSRGGSNP